MFKSFLLFLMDAGSDLGNFEMLFITTSGTISEKKLSLFQLRALCLCFHSVKLQFLQQSRPFLLSFSSFCEEKKTKLKSILRVHGHEICQFSETVLINCGVLIKLIIV